MATENITGSPFEVEPRPIGDLVKLIDSGRAAFAENTKLQERDRDYYDGRNQLDSETLKILNSRNQPPITFNQVDLAVNGILGVVQSSPTDPRAWPRTPSAEDAADVATKLLRYMADVVKLDEQKPEMAANLVIEGEVAVHIGVKQKTNRKTGEVRVLPMMELINPDEFFYDPTSRKIDFSDASYMGVSKWMNSKDVKARYAERLEEIGDPSGGQGGILGALNPEDRPRDMWWTDPKNKRVMVVELYYYEMDAYGEKEWYRTVFCSTGVLEHDVAGYHNDHGESICPIQAVSCNIDRENNRYGLVRGMIHAQDEINARRSRSLYMANNNKVQKNDPNYQYPDVDPDLVAQQAAKADGVLPPGYQLIPNNDLASGQVLLLNDAREFISRRAASPAVLGRVDEATSGRAKLVDQQAGLTELAITLARLGDLENRIYRHFWYAAQEFMDAPMMINITGDADVVEHIEVNQPIMEKRPQMAMGPDGQPVIDPMTGQPQIEMVDQLVEVKNEVAKMDMNISVTSVPQSPNLQSEVFEQFMKLMQTGLPLESPQFEFLIEMAPLQDKSKIRDLMKKVKEEAQQAQEAQAQAQQQIAQEQAQLAGDKAKSDIAKNIGHAQKAEADANYRSTETQILQAQMGYQPGLVPMSGPFPQA
jgi:ribosomal protein S20